MKQSGTVLQVSADVEERRLPDLETHRQNRAVRLIYLSLENDNDTHSVSTIQMSRQGRIEGDQDPPNKATRSNTVLPRAATISQTIQIITNKFRFPASPKLRRTRRKSPYERVTEDPHGVSNVEDTREEIIPHIIEDPSETEVFFKQSITTNQTYQVDLDDTVPYLDPLLEVQQEPRAPEHYLSATPPSPLRDNIVQHGYTLPIVLNTGAIPLAIPGTSSNTTHTSKEPVKDTSCIEVPQESETTGEEGKTSTEQDDSVELIDPHTGGKTSPPTARTPPPETTPIDDWNKDDVLVIEDDTDKDTPYTTAHNTLVIDDSDDAHSDCSTESEDKEAENTGFTTPPLTPSLVVIPDSPVKTPEKRSGFGNPPWDASQNTGHSGSDIPEPTATSSPKNSSPKVTKKSSTRMEQQTQNTGKARNSSAIKSSNGANQVPGVQYISDTFEELQSLLLVRQKSLPNLMRTLQRYPKLERSSLEVASEYYRATSNEFPVLELTRKSRDLLLDTLEIICTCFKGIPPQTLLLHSDLSTLLYTHTFSEIRESCPNVAEHLHSFYQLMFQNLEMHEGKPCRYNDVHELIETFYPTPWQELSRLTYPSTKPDEAHHALMRPIYELNVRVIHDLLDSRQQSPEITGDKRKSFSQADDNDTNSCNGYGKKVTILDSDIDTNTGCRERDDLTDEGIHNPTYTCNEPVDYSKNSHVSNKLDCLSMQDLREKECLEDDIKTECKVDVKAEENCNKEGYEHTSRSHKATDYYYDVNWRHESSGKKANLHKVPNKYSYYDRPLYRQEHTVFPVTQVPPPAHMVHQRTHQFQTVVPGTSGPVDLHAPPTQSVNTRGNTTLAGNNRNTQRSLSTSFDLNDRGTGNNVTPQPIPNFPDLTGRNNNNVTPGNTGVTGIGRIDPQATSTPNRNANSNNSSSNLRPGDPMYDLLSKLVEVQQKQTNSIAEVQFRDKKFDGSKPDLAHIHLTNFKSYWSRLLARKTATEDEYAKYFQDTLAGSAYEWFEKRKQDLKIAAQIQDAFLARYNKWGENKQICLDEWQSLKYPWAIPMDDFLQDLTNLAFIVEVTEEHKILTFKKSMPDEIKIHLVSCDSLSECAKTAENIINLFKRQNKIPVDAYQPDKDKQKSQSKNTQDKANTKKQENNKDRVNLHYEEEDLQQSQEEAFYQHSLDERDPNAQSTQGYGNPQRNNNRGRFQNQRGYRGGRGRGYKGQQGQYGYRGQSRDSDSNRQWQQQDTSSGDRNQNSRGGSRNEGYNNNNNRGYNNSRRGNRRSFDNRDRNRSGQSNERPSPTF